MVASLARTAVVAIAVGLAYFVLPLTPRAFGGVVGLFIGLVGVGVIVVYQVRAILQSPHPGLQAITGVALTTTLFIVACSTTYFLMSDSDTANFSRPLTRLDAAYFTVTTFATVGFGDIVATSQEARAVVTVQMVSGLVLVGIIARVVLGAVEEGRNRRRSARGPD